MELLRIEGLPDDPLLAAQAFYTLWLPRTEGTADLTIVFPPADHAHQAWRRAAVQELARRHAPRRINAVSGPDSAIAAAAAYLAGAPGVTGQTFILDDAGAGTVLGCAA